jgi:hypothetical protein
LEKCDRFGLKILVWAKINIFASKLPNSDNPDNQRLLGRKDE